MNEEIMLTGDYLDGEEIHSIYLGGGTPSLLSEKELGSLMDNLRSQHRISPEVEITIECNPDDVTRDLLEVFYNSGINRISLGIQSFDQDMLRFMNRAHDTKQAFQSLQWIRDSRIQNFSLDLIYALPSKDRNLFKKDLEKALEFQPPHISSYALTIEEKTAFGKWTREGRLTPTDEDQAAEQYLFLMETLDGKGYHHYEISNFAIPGFESRHNSSYWEQIPFLGIGPGAHSFNGTSRQHNIRNNPRYVQSIRQKEIPFQWVSMDREDLINEYILTSLRTDKGCDLEFLTEKYGYDLMANSASRVNWLTENKLIRREGNQLRLERSGKLLADKIASDLFT